MLTTLMIMEACPRKLLVLKYILNTFANSTGLKVNYSKSSMVPINLSPNRLTHLAATFQYQVGSLPFTYLGLFKKNVGELRFIILRRLKHGVKSPITTQTHTLRY
jgi:hypothetical protein